MGALEKVPGKQNWLEHLPAPMRKAWERSIIYRSATHQHREKGIPVGTAIASAINWAKHICATGDVKQWKGPQNVKPSSRAECCAAVALWESMKATANAKRTKDMSALADALAVIDLTAEGMESAGATLDLSANSPASP